MAATAIGVDEARARGERSVKSSIAVLVISSVEVALGLLAIGLVLEAQANRFDAGIDYVSVVGYASSAALAAALGLLTIALLASPRTRCRRLVRAHICLAVTAVAATTGNALVMQIHGWTTTISCTGCDAIAVTPTPEQIVASVAIDLGAAAAAALLPAVALLLLRNRRESAAHVG